MAELQPGLQAERDPSSDANEHKLGARPGRLTPDRHPGISEAYLAGRRASGRTWLSCPAATRSSSLSIRCAVGAARPGHAHSPYRHRTLYGHTKSPKGPDSAPQVRRARATTHRPFWVSSGHQNHFASLRGRPMGRGAARPTTDLSAERYCPTGTVQFQVTVPFRSTMNVGRPLC